MHVKVFEIVKSGLDPLSTEIEETVQNWLDENHTIEIISTSQVLCVDTTAYVFI